MTNFIKPAFIRTLFIASVMLIALGAHRVTQVAAAPLAASASSNYAGTASNTGWTNYSSAAGSPDGACATSPFAPTS